MKTICLATMLTLAPMALLGCAATPTEAQPDASAQPDTSVQHDASAQHDTSTQNDTSAPPEPLDIQGTWVFLGPGDGLHRLKITDQSMIYSDVDGQWSSTWTIKQSDNKLHHFQLVFASGTGTYFPTGQDKSGTYDVTGNELTVQLADGLASYPPMKSPTSCKDGTDNIPDCSLYYKEN